MNVASGGETVATAGSRLFLICDKDGQVTWMSDRTRDRLGPITDLLQAFPEHLVPELRRFLAVDEGPEAVVGLFQRLGRTAVPVQFSRLLSSESRLVVSVEVRERVTDLQAGQRSEFESLVALQQTILGHYFRLLRVQQMLDSRLRNLRPGLGALLTEQLERQRTRVARELHSGAGQALAGIRLHLELIEANLPEPPAAVRNSLDRIGLLAQEALAQVRSVSHWLHPPDWQRLRLRDAIENLWELTGIREKFRATLELQDLPQEPSFTARIVIYRAVQEALSNVIRHAGASEVRLRLRQEDQRLLLQVADNGTGFDTQKLLAGPPAIAAGIGLRALRDQIRSLHGEFSIQSGPNGTTLEISLPLRTDQ